MKDLLQMPYELKYEYFRYITDVEEMLELLEKATPILDFYWTKAVYEFLDKRDLDFSFNWNNKSHEERSQYINDLSRDKMQLLRHLAPNIVVRTMIELILSDDDTNKMKIKAI